MSDTDTDTDATADAIECHYCKKNVQQTWHVANRFYCCENKWCMECDLLISKCPFCSQSKVTGYILNPMNVYNRTDAVVNEDRFLVQYNNNITTLAWFDENGLLHQERGYPAVIVIIGTKPQYYWFKHGIEQTDGISAFPPPLI